MIEGSVAQTVTTSNLERLDQILNHRILTAADERAQRAAWQRKVAFKCQLADVVPEAVDRVAGRLLDGLLGEPSQVSPGTSSEGGRVD